MSKEIDWKAEYEKAEAERQALKEHVRDFMIRETVKAEARAYWSIDPEVAVKLADLSGCSFDEESNIVTGAHEAIQDLAARSPYLFAPKIKIPPPLSMGRKEGNELLDQIHRELGMRKF